jgi:TolA-binding protein
MESQDAVATFFLKLWPQIEANKNKIVVSAAIIVVAVAGFSFYSWRQEQNQISAGDALTQTLITLPQNGGDLAQIASSYLGIADNYPNTPAGARALLEGATVLFTAGKYSDAQAYFQQFLNAHPDDEFSGAATLGLAKCLEAEGKVNDAAGAYQRVINDFPTSASVLPAKFALAELNLQGRNYADAFRLFQEVAQANPYSPLGNEAAEYAYELRSHVPAPPSTTPGSKLNLTQ